MQYCVFCRNNQEPKETYTSHIVRNEKGIVMCPRLRRYKCPICGAFGDIAHTMKYCPKKKIVTPADIDEIEKEKRRKARY